MVSRSPQRVLRADLRRRGHGAQPDPFRLPPADRRSRLTVSSAHSLRHVIFGGEALEPHIAEALVRKRQPATGTQLREHVRHHRDHGARDVSPLAAADAERAGASPIGARIADLQLYVLDAPTASPFRWA